jgi:hypothetical protein
MTNVQLRIAVKSESETPEEIAEKFPTFDVW